MCDKIPQFNYDETSNWPKTGNLSKGQWRRRHGLSNRWRKRWFISENIRLEGPCFWRCVRTVLIRIQTTVTILLILISQLSANYLVTEPAIIMTMTGWLVETISLIGPFRVLGGMSLTINYSFTIQGRTRRNQFSHFPKGEGERKGNEIYN
jgi:hypothetical protein